MSSATSEHDEAKNFTSPYKYENRDQNDDQNKSTLKKEKSEMLVNSIKADGGAYKGCPKNDYCQHFVDTFERPQNFIRDYEEDKRFLDYPKLNELIRRKNEVLNKRATPPMYIKCDLKNYDLGTLGKFDIILIDPPWHEYYRRAEMIGQFSTDNNKFWTMEEISNLRIDLIADNCSFLFLWVGSEEGLDQGRMMLKKWGFRRCEDIVWIKTNKEPQNQKNVIVNKNNLLQHTKEHCLVGIKGAVKRGADSHFIHSNIDTDVIVSEEPPLGSTEKPSELYRIIERFCLGRKRIELFGETHNLRNGWLTLGEQLTSSNFDLEKYNSFFKGDLFYPDVEGYEGGRYVGCTPEIENLRPRSPTSNKPSNFASFGKIPIPNMSLTGQMPMNSGMMPMGNMFSNMNQFNNTQQQLDKMGFMNTYSSMHNSFMNNMGIGNIFPIPAPMPMSGNIHNSGLIGHPGQQGHPGHLGHNTPNSGQGGSILNIGQQQSFNTGHISSYNVSGINNHNGSNTNFNTMSMVNNISNLLKSNFNDLLTNGGEKSNSELGGVNSINSSLFQKQSGGLSRSNSEKETNFNRNNSNMSGKN